MMEIKNNTYTKTLEDLYQKADNSLSETTINEFNIPTQIINLLDTVVSKSESFKGVVNVLITSLLVKILNSEQDIRLHQASMKNGYSGRTIDSKYVVPFLKSKNLRSAKESGWLTRSLEQPYSYTLDYGGKIRDKLVKEAFLAILDYIQNNKNVSDKVLIIFFQLLIKNRDVSKISITNINDTSDTIVEIVDALAEHFSICKSYGRARLPVLAMYSIYTIITKELFRYKDTKLKNLSSHTSSDLRQGDIGDIQVDNLNNSVFEAVEIKYGINIDKSLILDAYNKFRNSEVKRYYILSTIKPRDESLNIINESILMIQVEHGCQVIVNGILETIKYYLRLISDTSEFIRIYTSHVLNDSAVKTEHKKIWKNILEKKLKHHQ